MEVLKQLYEIKVLVAQLAALHMLPDGERKLALFTKMMEPETPTTTTQKE